MGISTLIAKWFPFWFQQMTYTDVYQTIIEREEYHFVNEVYPNLYLSGIPMVLENDNTTSIVLPNDDGKNEVLQPLANCIPSLSYVVDCTQEHESGNQFSLYTAPQTREANANIYPFSMFVKPPAPTVTLKSVGSDDWASLNEAEVERVRLNMPDCTFDVDDDVLSGAIEKTIQCLDENRAVLVHCTVGRGRSYTFVYLTLMVMVLRDIFCDIEKIEKEQEVSAMEKWEFNEEFVSKCMLFKSKLLLCDNDHNDMFFEELLKNVDEKIRSKRPFVMQQEKGAKRIVDKLKVILDKKPQIISTDSNLLFYLEHTSCLNEKSEVNSEQNGQWRGDLLAPSKIVTNS